MSEERPPPPRFEFLPAALVAAALAALLVPDAPVGVGVVLTGLAAGVAVALAAPRPNAPSVVFGALGVLLLATAAVRAAEWVVVVNLLAALGLASAAATDAATWRDLALAPFRVAGAGLLAPRVLGEHLPRGARPERLPPLGPVLRGAAIAAVLLLVFGSLFATADPAFAHLAAEVLWPDWDLALVPVRVVVFATVLAVTVAFALAHAGIRREVSPWRERERQPRTLSRAEWVIPLVLLDALFLAFVLVQLTVLFGGSRHVLDTAGLTFAEYAIQGFHQLLLAAALTLAVVAWAVRSARRDRERDEVLLRALLGALCALTLVVLVSAFRRLALYEEMFGFSRDRLIPHALIVWLGGVFLIVMAAGTRMRAGWLPRAVVAFTAASLLGFTALDPDGFIARRNVERFQETGKLDVAYLSTLSADAVPALLALPDVHRCRVLREVAAMLAEEESWTSFNVARWRARGSLEEARLEERCRWRST